MTSKLPINLTDLLRQRTVEGERIENLGGGYVVVGKFPVTVDAAAPEVAHD
jgi:hypothetical protein